MPAIIGEPLPSVSRLSVFPQDGGPSMDHAWLLRGMVSHERYVTRAEKTELGGVSPPLGRSDASRAVLIPIRKSSEWWALPQDERRRIFEEQSNHIRIGLQFLPAIARRLHHCRDLSPNEPFDFLTWFEFAPSEENAFDDLLGRLRATEEWKFVTREVEVRLERAP